MLGVRARGATLVATLMGVVVSSCGGGWGDSCRTFVEKKVEFEPLTAGGSIEYAGDDFPITSEEPRPVHTCHAELSMPQSICGSSSASPSMVMILTVSCAPAARAQAGFYAALGDVRNLEVGDYPLDASSSNGPPYDATLHVVASTGQGGDYPNVVTSDFSKTLRVEVHSDFMDGSLEFELRADQFVSKPRKNCTVCYL